jgi:hypothetical protein
MWQLCGYTRWAPKPVWTLEDRKISLALAANRIPNPRLFSLYPIATPTELPWLDIDFMNTLKFAFGGLQIMSYIRTCIYKLNYSQTYQAS